MGRKPERRRRAQSVDAQLLTIGIPTIAVLMGILLNNRQIDHLVRSLEETNRRIDELRRDLTAQIGEVKADLTRKIDKVETDLTRQIEEVKVDLTHQIDKVDAKTDGIVRDLREFYVNQADHASRLQDLERSAG